MAGVLILAAGIPRAFDDRDFGVVTLGYVVMRLAMVAQWLRAAAVRSRRAARPRVRYAVGIAVVQVGWVAPAGAARRLGLLGFAGAGRRPSWPCRCGPRRAGRTTWHPGHIAERYGLFTIIVLGESVLAATVGVQAALDAGDDLPASLPSSSAGCSSWSRCGGSTSTCRPSDVVERGPAAFEGGASGAFAWGYGHYFVFAARPRSGRAWPSPSTRPTGHAELSARGATLAVAIPVALVHGG